MLIKFRLFCGCFISVALVFLSSCSTFEYRNPAYEVDLKQKTEVQLTYNQNVYTAFLVYESGDLVLEFADNRDAYDGVTFIVGKDFLKTKFKGMEYIISDGALTDKMFIVELFSLVSSNDGVIITEKYNEYSGCSYVTRQHGTHTFSFEVFENNGNFACSLKIT